MIYCKVKKIYNNKVALLECDKDNNGLDNSILINASLLEHFKRHYSYKYFVKNSDNLDTSNKDIQYIHTDKMIRLYHATINYNTEPKMKLFIPRVPETAGKNEISMGRVCLSDSIENCLNSISYGLCEYLHYVLPNSIIRVYSIDVPLDLGNIVFPSEVYHKYNVYDALFTNEHCCTNGVFMNSKLYKVTDFKYSDYYTVNDYEKDIFKSEILPKRLRNNKVFSEIDKYDFNILLNYCYGNNYELDRLLGAKNFSIDLEKEFSFDVKSEILKFINMSDFSFHDYILENTLKLEEIKEIGDYKVQSLVEEDCNESNTSSNSKDVAYTDMLLHRFR